MSGLVSQPLDLYLFRVVPPLTEPVATLYTTRSSRRSHLLALFWLPKHEKIAKSLVISMSLKWPRNDIYPVYVYPFFGLGQIIYEKGIPQPIMTRRLSQTKFSTFSDLRNYLRKGTFGVYFFAVFSNSLNMKRRQVLPFSDPLNLNDIRNRQS